MSHIPKADSGPWGEVRTISEDSEDAFLADLTMHRTGDILLGFLQDDELRTRFRPIDGHWEAPIPIVSGSRNTSDLNLVIDGSGTGHAVWHSWFLEPESARILGARMERRGSWSESTDLSALSTPARYAGEPMLALSDCGELAVAWREMTDAGPRIVTARSSADGEWTECRVLTEQVTAEHALRFDRLGNLWAFWSTAESAIVWSMCAAVAPAGADWQSHSVISRRRRAWAVTAAPSGATGMAAAWQCGTGDRESQIDFTELNENTLSTGLRQLSPNRQFAASCSLALDASGAGVAAWSTRDASGQPSIWIAERRTDGDWRKPVEVAGPYASCPSVVMAPTGTGFLTWIEADATRGFRVVASVRSEDGSWSSPESISADPAGARCGVYDLRPVHAAISDDGLMAAAWTRRLPSGRHVVEARLGNLANSRRAIPESSPPSSV